MTSFHTVNGVRIAVDSCGVPGGRPLLLLHNTGAAGRRTWADIAPAFTGTHPVLMPDFRGWGESGRPGDYRVETMRDDILGLLDLLGLERIDLIGHSLGGTVGWLVAQARPDQVERLVIEDSPLPRPGGVQLSPGERPAGEQAYDWDALVAVIEAINHPDPRWWELLPTVTARTLLIGGGPSSPAPQQALSETAALLPDARVVTIDVGHQVHRDAREAFLAETTAFLAR
jgi:3-oxoadipate enol-lactonase